MLMFSPRLVPDELIHVGLKIWEASLVEAVRCLSGIRDEINTGSGKCDVYEDRPMICRQYMSDFMRCRFDHKEFTDIEFSSMSLSTIKHLDQEAFKRSALMAVKPYNE